MINKIITIIIILALLGCNKEVDITPWKYEYWGDVSLKENGISCTDCKVRTITYNDELQPISLIIDHVNDNDFVTACISFSDILKAHIGRRVEISSSLETNSNDDIVNCLYSTLQGHGDVTGDTYHIMEEEDNWIFVEEWDFSTNEIKGSFQGSFVHDADLKPKVFIANPDTIRITEATFFTKVLD